MERKTIGTVFLAVVAAVAAAGVSDARCQQAGPGDGATELPTMATRAEVQAQLDSLRELAASQPGESEGLQRRIRIAQRRLAQGDFRAGDVVGVEVRPDSTIGGTFQVTPRETITMPVVGEIDLQGLLYSEAQEKITSAVAQYVRNPQVTIRPLTRIAVLGAVASPGYYDVSPMASLAEAIMTAGGPAGNADLEDVELSREGQNLLEDRDAPLETLTLADLGVRPGDRLVVPQSGQGVQLGTVLSVIGALGTISFTVSQLF